VKLAKKTLHSHLRIKARYRCPPPRATSILASRILLALLFVTSACARADVPRKDAQQQAQPQAHQAHPVLAAAVPTIAEPPPPQPALPPLEGEWLERLDVGGGEVAYVGLPIGARDKRAIVVGVHGAGDRADWSCSEWKAVTADWAFVVCPQGITHPTDKKAFVWGSAGAIAGQAERAVAALRAKYGVWIADGPLIYGGWSQGGTLAAQVIASRPNAYDRAVLVEVGHTPLDANTVVSSFVGAGIRRALVSCSSWKCRSFAETFEAAAKRRGLPVQTNDVGIRGHWFDGPVFRTLGPKVVWMVSDERRYAGLGAAVDARWMTD
jgi:hypothetical protein